MGKKKNNVWKMDAKRCLISWRFLGVVLAVAVICIMSMSENWKDIFSGRVRDTMSSVDQLNKMMFFDRFKPLLIVVLSMVYSNSFTEDWNHRYFRFIYSRSGIKRYACSKILVTILGVVLASILGFVLFGVIMYPWMRMGAIEGVFQIEACFSEYPELLVSPVPVLYLVIHGWNFGLSASCMAVAGLWLTVKKPNSFIGIGGPFFIFYFVYAISVWIMPHSWNYMNVSSFLGIEWGTQSLEARLLFYTLYLLVCNIIPAIGFYISLRKRWKNGTL